MKFAPKTPFTILIALLGASLSHSALAATHSENFETATGSLAAYVSPSGMVFAASGGSYIFSTQFNPYFNPYISGKALISGCNGCTAPTLGVSWPSGQRTLSFGWGTQGYTAARVTAYRDNVQVWQQSQSGTASNGLYKQQFTRTAANAGEYFDRVAITWPGGGAAGSGYATLVDNFTSTDAYATPALSGDNQITPVQHAYATPLTVLVRDSQNHPVLGVDVMFEAPSTQGNGATVIFAGSGDTFDTATTDANGIAVSSALAANAIKGTVAVSVSTSPLAGSATFHLTNLPADTLFANGFE